MRWSTNLEDDNWDGFLCEEESMDISGQKVYVLTTYVDRNINGFVIFSSYRLAEENITCNYPEGKWEKVMGKFQNPNYMISFRIQEKIVW